MWNCATSTTNNWRLSWKFFIIFQDVSRFVSSPFSSSSTITFLNANHEIEATTSCISNCIIFIVFWFSIFFQREALLLVKRKSASKESFHNIDSLLITVLEMDDYEQQLSGLFNISISIDGYIQKL